MKKYILPHLALLLLVTTQAHAAAWSDAGISPRLWEVLDKATEALAQGKLVNAPSARYFNLTSESVMRTFVSATSRQDKFIAVLIAKVSEISEGKTTLTQIGCEDSPYIAGSLCISLSVKRDDGTVKTLRADVGANGFNAY